MHISDVFVINEALMGVNGSKVIECALRLMTFLSIHSC